MCIQYSQTICWRGWDDNACLGVRNTSSIRAWPNSLDRRPPWYCIISPLLQTNKFFAHENMKKLLSKVRPGCPNQPRIDFSYYENVPRLICLLICDKNAPSDENLIYCVSVALIPQSWLSIYGGVSKCHQTSAVACSKLKFQKLNYSVRKQFSW